MKGLLKSLEAVIGIVTILTFFIALYLPAEPFPEFESISKQMKGFNSLKALDKSNELRRYVLANDTKTLERKLSVLLPEFNLKVVICEIGCEKPITSEEYTSVNYIIAGDTNDFRSRQIVLYIW